MARATNIQSVSMGDGNSHCGNIISSFNNIIYKSAEDAEIMRWLSPLEPSNRHQGVRTDRFAGVGDWLLETEEFRGWKASRGGADKAVLFCYGNPGVGKTYLSSLVVDKLCDQAKGGDIVVACFYYDFLARQEQTITNVMGAILKQLVCRGDIPVYLREAFQQGKMEVGGRGLRLADLMGMLRMAIASLPQVFICVDALDECLPKHLPELLKSLRDIVRESPRVRIFLTGRPHIGEDIQGCFPKAVAVLISPKTDDVRNYLQMRLDNDAEPQAMNNNLRADIIRIILERISDTFLLVSLKIDAILGETTIRQRRNKLKETTRGNGLRDAYTATLTRLKTQEGNKPVLGLKVLMWVLYSERPLRAGELCHAVGVETGSTDLDPENIPALRTLISSCLGLITIEESSSTVRLVHFTLQEYLSSDPTLFHNPHSTIAEVCLTYLNFRYVNGLSPTLYSAPSRSPLLEYASFYWGEHTRRGMTENVKALALKLLNRFDKHISAQLLLIRYNEDRGSGPYFDRVEGPTGFTGLHGVAFLGIADIVAATLEMKEWDVNAVDCMGSTALTWAARRGHEEVVNILLGREGVNPDKADTEYGQTPLSWAAECGHQAIVKMLLEQEDVNPDQADTRSGQTPLSWAAKCGHEGIVKILLQREDVNPNTVESIYGGTPLSWAASCGETGVVKIFLEREDVKPDQADTKSGRTPLSWAAEWGHEGVVKTLLERDDVNPNMVENKYGFTPLSWAALRGQTGVVKILLQRTNVILDQADIKHGRTPLLWAAEYGHEAILRMFLECEEVNSDRAGTKDGRTPLSWAAEQGHEGIVKMLLERADVDPDRADIESGRTPLSWAANGGYTEIVGMLLEKAGVNPNQEITKYGETPLLWAAKNGYEKIVKMLLERADVNPNTVENKFGCTPLSWAAWRGKAAVVKMLLGREDVHPNTADRKYGRTPLAWAAWRGHQGIVKMLLERKDVRTATQDNKHQPPMSLALSKRHRGVVKILLERGNANSDAENRGDQASPPSSTRNGG